TPISSHDMLFQIISLLLDVATALLGGACLLRAWMQAQRVPFGNPLGRFVLALSDWLVLPLRRLLRPKGRWDWACLVAAWIIEMGQYAILWTLAGAKAGPAALPLLALFGVVRLAISTTMGLVLIYAILSWVRADSPLGDVVDRLCAPMLRPLRRLLPLVGGVDLSPLALLVGLQIASMVLTAVQHQVLMGW
ncbi:MAG: hypothetical protein RLZ58_1269, partial [Pseudomonadota bacterium]